MQAENGSRPTGDRIHPVNLVTAWLAQMTDFYASVLNLETGERPPFRSTGAWLVFPHEAPFTEPAAC
jgi:catechol 2,3-dioxygenase-like lactoylglutathione lyase family enzyme